jgi:hypothetical protein
VETLAEFVISVLDLMQAQVRELRGGVFWIVLVSVFSTITLFFFVSGCGLLLWSVYACLSSSMGEIAARATVAFFSLALGGGTLWAVRRMSL